MPKATRYPLSVVRSASQVPCWSFWAIWSSPRLLPGLTDEADIRGDSILQAILSYWSWVKLVDSYLWVLILDVAKLADLVRSCLYLDVKRAISTAASATCAAMIPESEESETLVAKHTIVLILLLLLLWHGSLWGRSLTWNTGANCNPVCCRLCHWSMWVVNWTWIWCMHRHNYLCGLSLKKMFVLVHFVLEGLLLRLVYTCWDRHCEMPCFL